MNIPIQTRMTNFINYKDLENLIQENYNQKYKFVGDMTCIISTFYTFELKKSLLDKYDLEKLNEFKQKGKCNYSCPLILQDLVNNDLLPEGTLVVEVSW